jgi:hypothetical protein
MRNSYAFLAASLKNLFAARALPDPTQNNEISQFGEKLGKLSSIANIVKMHLTDHPFDLAYGEFGLT